jgi:lipopolysaccharide export system permease protein
MKIITKYILQTQVVIFFLVFSGLIGLYLLVDLAEKLNDFRDAGLPVSRMVLYFLAHLPQSAFELLPLSVLLSGVLTLLFMSRNNELTAMRSVGIKGTDVLCPMLFLGIAAALVMVGLQWSIIPKSTSLYQQIWQQEVKKTAQKGLMKYGQLFFHGENSIWVMKPDEVNNHHLWNVHYIRFDATTYGVLEEIVAQEALLQTDGWLFKKGVLMRYDPSKAKEDAVELVAFEEKAFSMPERPSDFNAVQRPPMELGLWELWQGIHRLKSMGYDAFEQESVFWAVIFYPFLGIALLWAVFPVMFVRPKTAVTLGLALALILSFIAWGMWEFLLALSKNGRIPAFFGPVFSFLWLWALGYGLNRRNRQKGVL